jgi:cytoskeletal protein CcmA (bactofilin family)
MTYTTIGRAFFIRGEVTAGESLLIEGRLEGRITAPEHTVVIGPDASGRVDVFARTVTLHGRLDGAVTASERIDVRETALVSGRLVAPRIGLDEGATFNGTIDTHRADAAVRVLRYRLDRGA